MAIADGGMPLADAAAPAPPPPISDILELHVVEAYTGADVGAVDITACKALDQECSLPLAHAQADDLGHASLTVAGGLFAFNGYLRVSRPAMPENYVFFAGRTPAAGTTVLDLSIYTPYALAVTATLAHVQIDPRLATLRVDARDCSGAPASGVQITIESNEPIASTQYFVDDGEGLATAAAGTDASGTVLGIGLSPGPVAATAMLGGQPVGAALGFVYAGGVTSMVVRP